MKVRRIQPARFGLFAILALWMLAIAPVSAIAAPYAAFVMDARTGEVLHSRNADTRLHPASLTKMMTLYVAFQAVEAGEISMDTVVTISSRAAAEPPSKLGLRAGQKIKLRFLVRAAAVKSANDAATAIAEAISGSEAAFARRMNRTAASLGMTRTTFKNAHGLTESGHLSTARDMSTMGRHMIYDYPQYYNLFSRISTNAGMKKVSNTNRRFLGAYKGADGIKTGYTRAAGFNLVSSAERGRVRIIATVFGGQSTASRNARIAELLDMGFRRAPRRAPLRKPAKPKYVPGNEPIIVAGNTSAPAGAGKIIRLSGAVKKSYRPRLRPGTEEPVVVAVAKSAILPDDIQSALEAAQTAPTTAGVIGATDAQPLAPVPPTKRPLARPQSAQTASAEAEPVVVMRMSTSGGRHWGINIGRYPSKYKAEKVLLQTALAEMSALDGSLRKVVARPTGFDANFMGMTRDSADLACRRLHARNVACFMIGPKS